MATEPIIRVMVYISSYGVHALFSAKMSSFCVTALMCVIPVIAMTLLISEVHLALTISNN